MTERSTTDGRTRRANEKRDRRRAAILSGALEVFGRQGYHQTHISDIIEAAGIARGTFYLYFDSKSQIFLELLDQLLGQLKQSIVGVDMAVESPPIELQLIGTVRRILDTVVQNRPLTTIIIREAVGLDVEADAKLRDFYDALLVYTKKALVEGKRLGIVREVDDEIAAMCILGTIKQFMELVAMSGPERTFDLDRMGLAVLDYNLRGLLAIS